MSKSVLSALAGATLSLALFISGANAAVIGSLDGYRTYGEPLTGGDYAGLVSDLGARGHSFAPAARDLTAGYLGGVDAFVHVRSISVSRTYPQPGEVDALKQWVSDGGLYVQFGGHFYHGVDLNRWAGAFGFNYVSRNVSGGAWSSSGSPLLRGITGGSAVNASVSNWVNASTTHRDPLGNLLAPEVFATIPGDGGTQNLIIGSPYGNGYVLFYGDENPVWGPSAQSSSVTFVDNVLQAQTTPVPLPAGSVLLISGLGGLLLWRRRTTVA